MDYPVPQVKMYLSILKLKMLINDRFHSNFTLKTPKQADEMEILEPLSIHKLKMRKRGEDVRKFLVNASLDSVRKYQAYKILTEKADGIRSLRRPRHRMKIKLHGS